LKKQRILLAQQKPHSSETDEMTEESFNLETKKPESE
jgi:hypothetical protein